MKFKQFLAGLIVLGVFFGFLGGISAAEKKITMLHVSYDPTREFYRDFNEAFASYWKMKTGETVKINQSHGGSGKQARAVLDGLEADVVSLALAYDVDVLHEKGNFISKNWQDHLPHNSSPFTSVIVLLVRKGNPKGIKDWEDLAKPGVEVITPNPKTSGGARWNYLAAWGYALKKWGHDEQKAKELVRGIYKNVPVLDSGARGSTTTFIEREIGDVLIAWENEALLALQEQKDKFEIIIPSMTILTEPPVTVVEKVAKKHGTLPVATAYLEYLYSEEGQEIAAKHFYRPRSTAAAQKYATQFPLAHVFTIEEVFGGWQKAQKIHFNDNGLFDQMYQLNEVP